MSHGVEGECVGEAGVVGAEIGEGDADSGMANGCGGGMIGGFGRTGFLNVVVDGGGDTFWIVESLNVVVCVWVSMALLVVSGQ